MRCFNGVSCSKDLTLHKIKLQVASWVPILSSFKGISIDSMMSSWKEVAFLGLIRASVFQSWSPPPLGYLNL